MSYIGMEFPKGKWVCYSRILGDGIFGYSIFL